MAVDLALVMPVYNEGECIAHVVASWRESLKCLGMSFRMIVLDDGSKDNTANELTRFDSDPAIEVIHQENVGHGPTILRGYRCAVELADWVFQCDSDDEISPSFFPTFWRCREQYDALFGVRERDKRSPGRMIISAVGRLTIRLAFGGGVDDVNVPYRLTRASMLRDVIAQIPPETFAPNVIISGAIARARFSVLQIPVRCEARKTGTSSITGLKIWKAAAVSFHQTLACRTRLEKRNR